MANIHSSPSEQPDGENNKKEAKKGIVDLNIRTQNGRNLIQEDTPFGKAIAKKYLNRDDNKPHTVNLPSGTRVALFKDGESKPLMAIATAIVVYKSSVGAIAVRKIVQAKKEEKENKPQAEKAAPPPIPQEEPQNVLNQPFFEEADTVEQSVTQKETPEKKSKTRIKTDEKAERALEMLLLRLAEEQRIELHKKSQNGKGWADALVAAAKAKYPAPRHSLSEMIQDVMHPQNATAYKLAEKLHPFLSDVISGAGVLSQEARVKADAKSFAQEILKRWGEDSQQEDVGVVNKTLSVAQIAARLQDKTLPLAVQAKNLALLDHAIAKELPSALSNKDQGQRKSAFGAIRDAVKAAQTSKAHTMLTGPEKRDFGDKMNRHLTKIHRAEG